jgi:ParB family transcriptional regulator, chromosome partitioning protein
MTEDTQAPEPQIETWPIANLKPHPKQAEFFDDASETELQNLVASIERNGLEQPIEILPDGTIIKGHQRLLACTQLGWTEVPVRIRDDLVGNDAEVEYELIADNVDRRQLDPVDIAVCCKRLQQLEKSGKFEHQGDHRKESLRARLAKQYGMTERNLSRYLRLASLARPIQQAVKRKALTLDAAAMISNLDKRQQQAIAEQITECLEAAGNNDGQLKRTVKSQLKAYLASLKTVKRPVADPLVTLVRSLKRAASEGGVDAETVNIASVKDELATLKKGRALLQKLIKAAEGEQT